MIVDKWLSQDFVDMHERQREQRLMRQGPTHHQGSRSLPGYKQAYEAAHPGEEISEFSVWAMSHMGRASSSVSFDPAAPPQVYSDPNVYTKVQEYTSTVRGIYGEDYNVRTEPIDAEAIMRLGGDLHY
ncbi:uncharacterized protein [Miscanthus floridulus]|uniref:uncharacterized protein n=1 Tax=Miscanthus floridulus TaxID=154761 RepID=UPI00345B322F